MNQQSNVIFAALFIAFLAFITMRGELRRYMGFLIGTPTGGTSPAAPAASTNGNPLAFGKSWTGPNTDNNIFNDIGNLFK